MKRKKLKTEALSLRVTPGLKRKLELLARKNGRSLNSQCEIILCNGYLNVEALNS